MVLPSHLHIYAVLSTPCVDNQRPKVLDIRAAGAPLSDQIRQDHESAGNLSGVSEPAVPLTRVPRVGHQPGRPRDNAAEGRILDAALRLYGERGWHGTSMQEIARAAGVSKGLLYSRWTAKEAVLQAAFDKLLPPPPRSASGPVREDLIAECRAMADLYLGPYGLALIRLWADAQTGPGILQELMQSIHARRVAGLRRRLGQAVRSQDLPPGTPVARLLDVLEGAVFAHVQTTPPQRREHLRRSLDGYIEALVDDQLLIAARHAPAEATGVDRPPG